MAVGDLGLFDAYRTASVAQLGRAALVGDGWRLTHADLVRRAAAVSSGLAATGVGRGDRVAVLAQNRPEILDLLFACARLGAILVPINWRMTAEEVGHVIRDVAPRLLVIEAESADLVGAASGLPDVGRFVFGPAQAGLRSYDNLVADGAAPPPPVDVGGRAGLLVIHTAAVGGLPRGALLTHDNLVLSSQLLAQAWRLSPDDVALGILPLFHISGLGLALAVLLAGGACVLPRRFDPAGAFEAIAREHITVMHEFAPILGQILDAAGTDTGRLASLRAVWGLDSPATVARFAAACPDATFWAGFGQSETSGFVTLAPAAACPGSAGRPLPLVDLEIVDDEDRPAALGTVGEITVRGPLVFAGYWGLDEDTAFAFRGGRHHTGDLGRIDEAGYLHYAGRSPAKELIKTGGENVYPAEVERVLREHPGIAEAVVFGLPDPDWGEAVTAICERAPGAEPDAAEAIAFVGARIARYKRPKTIRFVDALPRLANGAPDRVAIKGEFAR